ncbi:MAG: hypothetical protein ACOH10_13810 [Rhodoglobus sp.]
MAQDELANSRRSFRKATFTPVRLGEAAEPGGNALPIAAALRSLGLVSAESAELRRTSRSDAQLAAIDAADHIASAASAAQSLAAAAALGDMPRDELVQFVERVQGLRERLLAEGLRALQERVAVDAAPPEEHESPEMSGDISWAQASSMSSSFRLVTRGERLLSTASIDGSGLLDAAQRLNSLAQSAGVTQEERALRARGGTHFSPYFDREIDRQMVAFWNAIEPYLPPGAEVATDDPIAALEEIDRRRRAGAVVIDVLLRRNVEPLGLLHLESLDMSPVAIERGELLYSLPLAPGEKVTLSHKEWAVRETDFSDLVQDHLDNYSERGVAETDEIAISSQTEDRRTDKGSLGPSNGVTMGSAAGGAAVVTNARSEQESRQHSRAITSVASTRSVRDHKVSFTVATTTGSEDFTSRLIENPSNDHTIRVDYFRRMRRWRVDLHRVGVRMTYDVVIPDPGRRLRARHELLRSYDRALATTFNAKVSPRDITGRNWQSYASGYGAVGLLPPPPGPASGPAYELWQLSSFAGLRDAAYARYVQVQDSIRVRRVDLARQIESAADASTLRRLEREQLMRGVLDWLFPGFADAAPSDEIGNPTGLSDASWRQVMEYGEYIKFIHAAIDWDRLTWQLFPYFWGAPGTAGFDKVFLSHPDDTHATFLRAGAARVILPIQPGAEGEVASLLDLGRVGTLPAAHRFQAVIDEVTAAQAKYDALTDVAPTAAGGAGAPSLGKLIGTWTEFTPTGALDMEVSRAAIK